MDAVTALGEIILKSLPTFFLVWILYFVATRIFIRPLQNVLRQRREATEGLRETAEARLQLAEQKTIEYEQALRASAAEIYRQQEQERQRALEQRAQALRQARQRAEERLAQARQQIRREAEEARAVLERESEQIAAWITDAILQPESAAAAAPEVRRS